MAGDLPARARHNLGYLQWGSIFTHQEKAFLAEPFRLAAARAYRRGFEGLTTYGEESPLYPNVELNYLAFSEFSYNPDLSLEEFLETRVAPLYGGATAARAAWDLAGRIGDVRRGRKVPGKDALLEEAYRRMRLAAPYGRERWTRMIDFIRTLI